MAGKRILVVEDDEDILELVTYNLVREGYQVNGVTNGEDALREAFDTPPDVIILDLMLPGIDGLEVCKSLKSDARTANVPVIMLTAKGEESDVVSGLELGADDYITKPFSPKILIARTRTIIRRARQKAPDETEVIKTGDLVLHPGRHEALLNGRPLELTPSEFSLLHMLARRPGWVFTREQIIAEIKGDHYSVTDRSVDVQVAGLRKKLGKRGSDIETVRGIGYKFKE